MTQTRMSKTDRREQLLGLAAEIVRKEGAERLTLLTLAERAGVSKPVTYNHFGDRKGLLVQLYQGYDERLVQDIRGLDQACAPTLEGLAHKLAMAYFECTLRNGEVYDAVVAALCNYPEYRDLRIRICRYFVDFYHELFGPVVQLEPSQSLGDLISIYGASDELARALTGGLLSKAEAVDALSTLIIRTLGGGIRPSADGRLE
ncbi:TetR/AcrR family transcriptional regulator [Marinobacterium maritimum]|uniref:TetR/AcrR family transcriptional regulator n=1 Tax=Marinobacterium maritimum TaxID=500162 RepID=A0ABN1I330_9GAMM